MRHYPWVLILSLVYPVAQGLQAAETSDTGHVVEASEPGTAVFELPGARPAAKAPEKAEVPNPAEKAETPKTSAAREKAAGEASRQENKPVAKLAESAHEIPDGSVYFPKLIGIWKLSDARHMLGEPIRQRPSMDADQRINGHIYAFADPTNRYKSVELEFTQEGGLLRGVFMYPSQMTWKDCRKLWGMDANATEAGKGRTFYSYNNRHLDVLVDPEGKVISLGLY